MTREEAIRWLICVKEEVDESEGTMIYISKKQADALGMAIEALQERSNVQNMHNGDLISKADAIELCAEAQGRASTKSELKGISRIWQGLLKLPSAEAEWIPCSERLPKELEAVNVTWVNHNPPVYYQHIKDVPKADTAVYYRGAWYWWDATVIDLLGEYDGAYIHGIEPIDKDIEVTAWMPLPKPYREDGEV